MSHDADRMVRLLAALIMATVCAGDVFAFALDRYQLGQIMQAIPPNGPFWRYGNVTMRKRCRKAGIPPVVFPHWAHRTRYTCRVCHVELDFTMRAGSNEITRQEYLTGKYCGACHDGSTAFSVQEGEKRQCSRCHLPDPSVLEARFNRLAASLPPSQFGNGIDWTKAELEGMIVPADTILPRHQPMALPEKLKGTLELKTVSPRSDVRFSHKQHFSGMDCSMCHPDIFKIRRNGTELFSMELNLFGQFCGACHMRVAFPMNDCKRCHESMTSRSGF